MELAEDKLAAYCLKVIGNMKIDKIDNKASKDLALFYLALVRLLILAPWAEPNDLEILTLICKNEDIGHSKEFIDIYKAWVNEEFVESVDINTENITPIVL